MVALDDDEPIFGFWFLKKIWKPLSTCRVVGEELDVRYSMNNIYELFCPRAFNWVQSMGCSPPKKKGKSERVAYLFL